MKYFCNKYQPIYPTLSLKKILVLQFFYLKKCIIFFPSKLYFYSAYQILCKTLTTYRYEYMCNNYMGLYLLYLPPKFTVLRYQGLIAFLY